MRSYFDFMFLNHESFYYTVCTNSRSNFDIFFLFGKKSFILWTCQTSQSAVKDRMAMQKLGYKKSFCPKMVFNRIGQKKERKVNGGNGILWHVPKPLMVILHLYWKKKQRVERKEAVFVDVVGKKEIGSKTSYLRSCSLKEKKSLK